MKHIYHVTTAQNWQQSQQHGTLSEESLALEGFIHCCTADQLSGVGSRYFKGLPDLVVLTIDEAKVKPELKYEVATHNELYPHIFGELNTDAVIKAEPISF